MNEHRTTDEHRTTSGTQERSPSSARTTSRRAALAGVIGAAGAIGVVASAGPAAAAGPEASRAAGAAATATAGSQWGRGPHRGSGKFVQRAGAHLTLDGARWRFAGANCYYLHYTSHYMIDSALNDIAQMGLSVVRAWAYIDGEPANGFVMQPSPGVYDEAGFEALDYTVWKAGQLNLRLVLGLVNNWPTYGGMDQYVTWFGAKGHDAFYTDPKIRAAYKAYAAHVVGRRNRYTGKLYSEDPTVMTWELANEPRCTSDTSGDTLVAWADEMSRYVRSVAPRQLVAVGDEGFYGRAGDADYPYSAYEGVAWPRLTALPAVDYGTVHCYPDGYKSELDAAAKADWGVRWIADHVRDAAALGKPVVIEEFGLEDASADQAYRDAAYRRWTGEVVKGQAASDMVWLVTARQDDGAEYANYDGYRVLYPSSTAALLTKHADAMVPFGFRR